MPSDRRLKDALYEQIARISKALASPRRLELVELLCQCPRTVDALSELTGMSVANTSQHLQVLREARLIEGERLGTSIRYQLAEPAVAAVYAHLRALAFSRLAEVDGLLRALTQGASDVEVLDGPALHARVAAGKVTVLDVRPAEEWAGGHWPGARSLPITEIAERIADLPRGQTVVAYCRGPCCVFAVDAASLLRAAGLQVARMSDGPAEWIAAGLPLERD